MKNNNLQSPILISNTKLKEEQFKTLRQEVFDNYRVDRDETKNLRIRLLKAFGGYVLPDCARRLLTLENELGLLYNQVSGFSILTHKTMTIK
jgi:hypothetical protein